MLLHIARTLDFHCSTPGTILCVLSESIHSCSRAFPYLRSFADNRAGQQCAPNAEPNPLLLPIAQPSPARGRRRKLVGQAALARLAAQNPQNAFQNLAVVGWRPAAQRSARREPFRACPKRLAGFWARLPSLEGKNFKATWESYFVSNVTTRFL
jgi:hypothetical protein